FALLGNHPDGLAMTLALLQTGRHQLLIYSGPIAAGETLRSSAPAVKFVGDLEEVLADPAIEAVIVAGKAGDRVAQLRRALQSERHVLCVHPPDCSPAIAYAAAMTQGDSKQTLFPLITEGLHPGALRLGKLTRQADGPLGKVRLVSIEWSSSGE